MRILSISAQKPNSTGSGVYMTELINAIHRMGHEQAMIAGIYKEDKVELPDKTIFYPVFFHTKNLPFAICGMSDEMPYESTKYSDMSVEMLAQFKTAFIKALDKAIKNFSPDYIICHHLYLLTSIVRERYPNINICGVCHNTDIRQMIKNKLERNFIKQQVANLNNIFVASDSQKKLVISHYEVQKKHITVLGSGYNRNLFCPVTAQKDPNIYTIMYAGKISEKKGVKSLIRSLEYLQYPKDKVAVNLIGSAGNKKEYDEILKLAEKAKYKINFIGALPQDELAEYYCSSDLFVLPSFSEAIPLVVIEALACGTRVVVSDLPGVRDWIDSHIANAHIDYVHLPRLDDADIAREDDLQSYEKRIAKSIKKSLSEAYKGVPDMSAYTWESIAEKIIAGY